MRFRNGARGRCIEHCCALLLLNHLFREFSRRAANRLGVGRRAIYRRGRGEPHVIARRSDRQIAATGCAFARSPCDTVPAKRHVPISHCEIGRLLVDDRRSRRKPTCCQLLFRRAAQCVAISRSRVQSHVARQRLPLPAYCARACTTFRRRPVSARARRFRGLHVGRRSRPSSRAHDTDATEIFEPASRFEQFPSPTPRTRYVRRRRPEPR